MSGPYARPMGAGTTSSNGGVPGGATGQISRVGFISVMVLCSLAILAALIMLAQYLLRRRDRFCDYLSTAAGMVTGGGYGSRKTSEAVQKGPLTVSGSSLSTRSASQHADSVDKHQQSQDSLEDYPPPYQTAVGQDPKQVGCLLLTTVPVQYLKGH